MSQPNYNYRPSPNNNEENGVEMIVVGAGIAGLFCASELQKLGVKVKIFEASHHMGGRIRTLRENEFSQVDLPSSHHKWLRFHAPPTTTVQQKQKISKLGEQNFGFEVGAEFVHGSTTLLNRMIEERGFQLKELFTWAHGDGGPSPEAAPDGGYGCYWLGREKKLIRFDEQDEEMKHLVDVLWALGDRSAALTDDDPRSFHQYLVDEGVTERVIGFAENGYANTVAGTLRSISFSLLSQCERNWYNDGDGDFRLPGTLEETIVRTVSQGLDIQFNSPVRRIIQQEEGGVVVEIMGGEKVKAAGVVVTASITALQRGVIDFQPALPKELHDAIHSIACEPALKLLVKFASRFWPEKLHGMVCSDSFAPEIWFDTYDDASTSSTYYYATAFFTSDQARHVSSLATDEAFRLLLHQFNEMFQTKCEDVYLGGFMMDWGAVPYIWGGYSTPSLKELPEARSHLAKPFGHIYFAGEATDPDNFMTAHAAAQTGQRAALLSAKRSVLQSRLTNLQSLHHQLSSKL